MPEYFGAKILLIYFLKNCEFGSYECFHYKINQFLKSCPENKIKTFSLSDQRRVLNGVAYIYHM